MKILGICLLTIMCTGLVLAQQPGDAGQKSISNHLGLHAFPAKNQNPEQQQADEFACYRWAKQDTAFDPLAALEASQSAKTTAPTSSTSTASMPGAGIQGAARGAAAGAAVGAIAGDAGQGAAIGAAGGGLRARMAQKRAQAEAEQRAQRQAQQQSQQQAQAKAKSQANLDDFKKAYGACMEGKGYSVR